MQLRPPHWLREHATALTTIAYLAAALVLGASAGAVAVPLIDDVTSPIASGSAEAILSAIASGMMALTAILFSLLFVAIQVGGSWFSPRLVRVLGRTRFLGHALGVFAGTFVYALLAIRTIDLRTQPGINVSVILVAFLWLFGSIAVLLLLVLHLRRLDIAEVLSTLYDQTARAAVRVYAPMEPEASAGDHAPVSERPAGAIVRYAGRPQYLLGFDVDRLVCCATRAECVIHVPLAIGDPVVAGVPLAIVVPATGAVDEATVREALWLGPQRIIDNDPAYGIRLLVDVAIRALSPAVNDPTTAISVIDRLDGLLRVLAGLRLEDNRVRDASGTVRLVFDVCGWGDLVALALTEIAEYGRDSRQVRRRMASLMDDLEDVLPGPRRAAIARFASWRPAVDAAPDRQGLGHAVSPPALSRAVRGEDATRYGPRPR